MHQTAHDIAELYSKFARLEAVEREATDALNAAKDAGKESELPVPQADGTGERMVPEKYLWKEVFALGTECAASVALRKKYPRVFELYAEQNRLADDLRDFTIRAFRIDYTQLRITDIVRMFELMYEYKAAVPAAGRGFMGRLWWLITGN